MNPTGPEAASGRPVAPLGGVVGRATPDTAVPNPRGGRGDPIRITASVSRTGPKTVCGRSRTVSQWSQLPWIASMTIAAAMIGSFGTVLASSMVIS